MWNVNAFIEPRLDLFWIYHGGWMFAEIFRHNLILAILVVRCYLAKKVCESTVRGKFELSLSNFLRFRMES